MLCWKTELWSHLFNEVVYTYLLPSHMNDIKWPLLILIRCKLVANFSWLWFVTTMEDIEQKKWSWWLVMMTGDHGLDWTEERSILFYNLPIILLSNTQIFSYSFSSSSLQSEILLILFIMKESASYNRAHATCTQN